MKAFLIACLCIISANVLVAQKHDYQWLFGYGNSLFGIDSFRGCVKLDFTDDTVDVSDNYAIKAGFDASNTVFSDTAGNLMFYSNGTDIYDRRDSIMENGDSLNYGWYWDYWITNPNLRYEGLRIFQSMLSLPSPSDPSKVYVMHFSVKFCWPDGGFPSYFSDTSYYSLVDINGSSGYGEVIKKNIKISIDSLSGSGIAAAKHGNGKDWWILRSYFNGNCYYKFLLNDTGVGLYDTQCLGDARVHYGDFGTSCFSPNGEKYFWVTSSDGIHMFDFDRCTGFLSNAQVIAFPIPSFADSVTLIAGIAVSPNNRFLYVFGRTVALQYDLEAVNISESVDTVAIWDGAYDPSPFASTFFIAQLAPDGKIYVNSTNGTISLHVINNPDKRGDSCFFEQRGLRLNTYNQLTMPSFPNYRLGPKVGSSCDTLTVIDNISPNSTLKIFPSPADNYIIIDYGFVNWQYGSAQYEIHNILGELTLAGNLPDYSGLHKIVITDFPIGFYTVRIVQNARLISAKSFVKQ